MTAPELEHVAEKLDADSLALLAAAPFASEPSADVLVDAYTGEGR